MVHHDSMILRWPFAVSPFCLAVSDILFKVLTEDSDLILLGAMSSWQWAADKLNLWKWWGKLGNISSFPIILEIQLFIQETTAFHPKKTRILVEIVFSTNPWIQNAKMANKIIWPLWNSDMWFFRSIKGVLPMMGWSSVDGIHIAGS